MGGFYSSYLNEFGLGLSEQVPLQGSLLVSPVSVLSDIQVPFQKASVTEAVLVWR